MPSTAESGVMMLEVSNRECTDFGDNINEMGC